MPVMTLSLSLCSLESSHPRRGKLRDTVLDWEDELPADDMDKAQRHSRLVEG